MINVSLVENLKQLKHIFKGLLGCKKKKKKIWKCERLAMGIIAHLSAYTS